MAEQTLLILLGVFLLNPAFAYEAENVDMGLIEFLGEGKIVDGEWVDPIMIEDEEIVGSEEQNDE